jgi:hypothetical protein
VPWGIFRRREFFARHKGMHVYRGVTYAYENRTCVANDNAEYFKGVCNTRHVRTRL